MLPQKFDVPRILSDQQRLKVKVDHLLAGLRGDRGVADADEAGVGEDFHDEPLVERERAHRRAREQRRDDVHRVGTKVRRQRDGLALPLHDTCADFSDFHSEGIVGSKGIKTRQRNISPLVASPGTSSN